MNFLGLDRSESVLRFAKVGASQGRVEVDEHEVVAIAESSVAELDFDAVVKPRHFGVGISGDSEHAPLKSNLQRRVSYAQYSLTV